jgi:predicted ester cyclase
MHGVREMGIRWFEEVWNKGRREAIGEMLLPESVIHEGGKDSYGPEGFYPFYDRLQEAFSDWHFDFEQTIVEKDCVCVRWRVSMKHTGHGMGMEPTGRTVHATGMSVVRIAGDKLLEGWQNWDMLGLLAQMQTAEPARTLYI